MTKDKRYSPVRRRRSAGTGIWCSDEIVFGLSRGIYPSVQRSFPDGGRRPEAPRDSFEETYPKYAFSELVRLGIVFGSWLARVRGRVAGESLDGLPQGNTKA